MASASSVKMGSLVRIGDDVDFMRREFANCGIPFLETFMAKVLGLPGRVVGDPYAMPHASVLALPRLEKGLDKRTKVIGRCVSYSWPFSCLDMEDMPDDLAGRFYLMDRYQYFTPFMPAHQCIHYPPVPNDFVGTVRVSMTKCSNCMHRLFPMGNDLVACPEEYLIPVKLVDGPEAKVASAEDMDSLLADIWDARGTEGIGPLLSRYKGITGRDKPGFLA